MTLRGFYYNNDQDVGDVRRWVAIACYHEIPPKRRAPKPMRHISTPKPTEGTQDQFRLTANRGENPAYCRGIHGGRDRGAQVGASKGLVDTTQGYHSVPLRQT